MNTDKQKINVEYDIIKIDLPVNKELTETESNGDVRVLKVFKPKKSTLPPLTMYATPIAAGLPSPVKDYNEGELDLNEYLLQNPSSTFFVRVSGDSMIGASIHPGDLLIVDCSLQAQDGKIVIAIINGELTVKRLFYNKGKRFLMPENPTYSSIEITKDMDFMIWGIVTNVIHQL